MEQIAARAILTLDAKDMARTLPPARPDIPGPLHSPHPTIDAPMQEALRKVVVPFLSQKDWFLPHTWSFLSPLLAPLYENTCSTSSG